MCQNVLHATCHAHLNAWEKETDRAGDREKPKPYQAEDSMSLLAELDTHGAQTDRPTLPLLDTRKLAERTLKACSTVRWSVGQLMKYMVKACRYCSEVHMG